MPDVGTEKNSKFLKGKTRAGGWQSISQWWVANEGGANKLVMVHFTNHSKILLCSWFLAFAFSCSNIDSDNYEWVVTNDTVAAAGAIISYQYPDNLVKSVEQNDKSTLFISFGFPVEPTEDDRQLKDDGRLFILVYDNLENVDTLIKARGTDAFAFESTSEKKEILVGSEKALRVTFRANDITSIVREMIFLTYKNNLYEIDANEFSAADLDIFIQHFRVANSL